MNHNTPQPESDKVAKLLAMLEFTKKEIDRTRKNFFYNVVQPAEKDKAYTRPLPCIIHITSQHMLAWLSAKRGMKIIVLREIDFLDPSFTKGHGVGMGMQVSLSIQDMELDFVIDSILGSPEDFKLAQPAG